MDIRGYDEGASTWGGWVNLLHYDASTVLDFDANPEEVDLSAYDGRRIQIRWHFYEAVWDYWFALDNIMVSGEPAGPLPLGAKGTLPSSGKNITLRSEDPFDSAVVARTIIDGGQNGPVVTFMGEEMESCMLAGFVIRNGRAYSGGGVSGGTSASPTRATIRNNVITANSSDYDGGGLAYCDGAIHNNVVFGNSAGDEGGGLFDCDGIVENNTIYDNSAVREGGGLDACGGPIRNCIVWENSASNRGPQIWESSALTYSCIQNWREGGEGNISSYPHFVDPEGGDFHLRTWSPCVDAGDPSCDFSNEPQPNGGRINMGAYGNTREAARARRDVDKDLLPDDWEMHFFGNLSQVADDDADGDRRSNLLEYLHGTNPAWYGKWHVDRSVAISGDGTSWATAFRTIQEGIDVASEGDMVVVAQGTYRENVGFKGRNITVTSIDPFVETVVTNTIIDGGQNGSVVTFSGTEDESCVLCGFTIQGGVAQYGGGIAGNATYARIEWNRVTENSATRGGGIYLCNGPIVRNVISGNTASDFGGGITQCNGQILDNTIFGNSAQIGGGVAQSDGEIRGNVITANSANGGGGLAYCEGEIRNNTIAGNRADGYAGGLYQCEGTIENNAICCNYAQEYGGGLAFCGGVIRNCIVWGNIGGKGDAQVHSSVEPSYCCVQDSTGGVGNISLYPHFVNAPARDYHLQSWSPCIDAGDPSSDFSKEPRPNGERINMGAYGNTPEAASACGDADGDLLPDDWELHFFGDIAQAASDDPDGDGKSNLQEYRDGTDPKLARKWHVAASAVVSGDGTSWETAFRTIQEGINTAWDGDMVVVAEGRYVESIHFLGKNIELTSTNPLDPDVVRNTVIDGAGAGAVVTFSGSESEHCVLSGFTICNGKGQEGGGICGGNWVSRTRATIRNNVVRDNSALSGGGIACCDGMVENNSIIHNSASSGSGGGLHFCGGVIRNNVITENHTAENGGGMAHCFGEVVGNTVIVNGAAGDGGGMAECEKTIRNNIVAHNAAGKDGGGAAHCSGDVVNNTIAANSASYNGGGLYDCDGAIKNCIIWGNVAPYGPQLYDCPEPLYCCIQGWEDAGVGNISGYPYFADPEAGDYHLRSWSPCVDAGDPASDFSNEPQPNGGRINMGAYGNTPEAASASADTDHDLLPDDWEMHFFDSLNQGPADDPDDDGVWNLDEYRRGTKPTGMLYVNAAVDASGNGTTPECAFKTIQEGIDAAEEGQTVRILPGRYVERLLIRKKVSLIGSGTGLTIIDANGGPTPVTIIGLREAHVNGQRSPANQKPRLDIESLTITNAITDSVGAIYCSNGAITVNNCRITGNSAAFGASIFLEESSAIISGCEMSGNFAEEAGGAICAWASELLVTDCFIRENRAGTEEEQATYGDDVKTKLREKEGVVGEGGGIYSWWSLVRLVRTTIAGNSAMRGGAIFCEEGPVILVNCTIADNAATEGAGGIHCQENAPRQSLALVSNSIVWGNGQAFSGHLRPEITFSDIEDASFSGFDGNISAPPMFMDQAAGDYRLEDGSPCIDAGNPEAVYNDQDGSLCDMGAFGGTGNMGPVGLYVRTAHVAVETDAEGKKCIAIYWIADPSASFFVQSKYDIQEPWRPGAAVEPHETWLNRWQDARAIQSNRRMFYRIGTTISEPYSP